jgi:hypothetical protein
MQIYHVETSASKTIQRGLTRIIPLVKTVQIFLPYVNWGLSWNKPVAVIVRTSNQERVLVIEDATRRAQWAMLGIGLIGMLLVKVLKSNKV